MAQHFHRLLVEATAQALLEIFKESRHADKVIEATFMRNRKWGARDRRFFAETVYDCVRWWRRLHWCLGDVEIGAEPGQGSLVQLKHAEWAVRAYFVVQAEEVRPDWLRLEEGLENKVRLRWESADQPPAVAASLPDWLYNIGLEELGEQWPRLVELLNGKSPQFLRVNTLRGSWAEAQKKLRTEGIETEKVAELAQGLRLLKRQNVFTSASFKEGWFEMQDGGSQMVAPLLGPEPGDRVVDACAGAGGKSLHLAALMGNKGKIISMDIHEHKLEQLRLRARRAGVDVIETRKIDSLKQIKRLKETADRLLLDVPCSGSGVWRRNPDSRWKLLPEQFAELKVTQQSILQNYSQMVKPGGVMVYATCSVFQSENQMPVQSFLESEVGVKWQLEKELVINPEMADFDGFYAAKLVHK